MVDELARDNLEVPVLPSQLQTKDQSQVLPSSPLTCSSPV